MNNTIAPIVTKSNLMKAFNAARLAKVFEPKRLNRALGIVQRNSTKLLADGRLDIVSLSNPETDWHLANAGRCDCMDAKKGNICMHRISKALIIKAQRLSEVKE